MKLNYKRTIYIGLAFFIISMFWVVYDNIIAKMLINYFGLNQTASGVVMALDNIVALFMLPLFGALSDKTKSKYGKRTPYIVIGVLLSAVFFIGVGIFGTAQQKALEDSNIPEVEEIVVDDKVIGYSFGDLEFKPQEGEETKKLYEYKELALKEHEIAARAVSQDNMGYLIGFIVILCIVLIIMSIYRTPAVSLMPDVTPKPLRSKANAIINLMGTVAGILCLGIIMVNEMFFKTYMFTFILLPVLMVGFLILFLIKIKEPELVQEFNDQYPEEVDVVEETTVKEKMPKDVRKSFMLILLSVVFWFMAYNAATSKFSVYAGNVLNTMFTTPLQVAYITAAIAFIPIGIVASKIGRKKTIIIGILILLVAFLIGSFLTEKTKGLIYVTMGLAGIGWATINVNSYPMVVEMSKSSNIGKYTGYYYTASMAAQIITPVLSGLVMDGFFIKSLGTDMRRLFPYSVVFCVLALITMLQVKHGDAKPIPSEVQMDD